MTDIPNHLVDLKAQIKERSRREKQLIEDPDIMDIMCSYVAAGGTLVTLCEMWDVSYGRIATWVNKDKERRELLNEAYHARSEWAKERILHELRCLSHVDIRKIIDPNTGAALPIHEWPPEVSRALESVDVQETFEGYGEERQMTGYLKKFKFNSKLKALELLGKTEALFTEKIEIKAAMTLAELVDASWKDVTPNANSDDT